MEDNIKGIREIIQDAAREYAVKASENSPNECRKYATIYRGIGFIAGAKYMQILLNKYIEDGEIEIISELLQADLYYENTTEM